MAGKAANDQFHSMKLRLCFFVLLLYLCSPRFCPSNTERSAGTLSGLLDK